MKKILDTDSNGNELIYESRVISLRLKGHTRKIAHITGKKDEWTLVLTRNRKLHRMLVNNSYGICYDLLIQCRNVGIEKVKIVDEVEEFNMSLNFLLDKGEFLHFLEQGFEKQIFIPLNLMK